MPVKQSVLLTAQSARDMTTRIHPFSTALKHLKFSQYNRKELDVGKVFESFPQCAVPAKACRLHNVAVVTIRLLTVEGTFACILDVEKTLSAEPIK